MAKCPECDAQIDHLISSQEKITGFRVEDGKPLYDHGLLDPFNYSAEVSEEFYYCPRCGADLFDSEGEAVYFFVHSGEEPS